MLYGSETWAMSRDNEARLERNEMKMIRWMAGVKLTDRFRNSCLRERLGLEDIQLILRKRRLRWFGHVERREGCEQIISWTAAMFSSVRAVLGLPLPGFRFTAEPVL